MKKASVIILKIISTAAALFASYYALIIIGMFLFWNGINHIIAYIGLIVVPSLLLPLIWLKKKKMFLIIWCICAAVYGIALGTNFGIIRYNESVTVNTSPNIDVYEYLPFKEDSKIVKTDSKTLKLTENLPRIDGAAALFPVYSAFVNAVYPKRHIPTKVKAVLWKLTTFLHFLPERITNIKKSSTNIPKKPRVCKAKLNVSEPKTSV